MSQPNAPLVDVEKIDVKEGFNVRTHMNADGIERLAANFRRVGVVEPVVVEPGELRQLRAGPLPDLCPCASIAPHRGSP